MCLIHQLKTVLGKEIRKWIDIRRVIRMYILVYYPQVRQLKVLWLA
jgi:hypothetical protein